MKFKQNWSLDKAVQLNVLLVSHLFFVRQAQARLKQVIVVYQNCAPVAFINVFIPYLYQRDAQSDGTMCYAHDISLQVLQSGHFSAFLLLAAF